MSIPEKIFITGTDTGIGKTVVSTILALGMGTHYWKPIQSGALESRDSDFAADFLGKNRVFPEAYCLQAPLSPKAAAEKEDIRIEIPKLLAMANDFFSKPIVVEGAGGVLVPIVDHYCMIDYILDLALPVVVVARSGLGTINHSLLTLESLKRRNIAVCGLVLVGERNADNRKTIQDFSSLPVIGEVPFLENFSREKFLEIYSEFDWKGLP